ncbi:MAG: FliM/FliN family flagellar motor switch protein [Terracidiphilus sp.]
MATTHPLPAPAGAPHPGGVLRPGPATTQRAAAGESAQALVPAPQPPQSEAEPVFRPPISQLPVAMGVSIPVREFRVRQLLALAPGQVIETQWSHGDDLPLAAGDVQLAWSEFEVVETRLAVRVTRLA